MGFVAGCVKGAAIGAAAMVVDETMVERGVRRGAHALLEAAGRGRRGCSGSHGIGSDAGTGGDY